MSYKSPLEMLYKWEQEIPDQIYLSQPIDDVPHEYTWKQTAEEVRKMAAYLKSLDLPEGSNIGILSKNCAHWIMSDLSIMMAGHVSVPLYPNLTAESIRQILDHSGTQVLFAGKLDDFHLMKPGISKEVHCISYPFYAHKEYDNWKDLVDKVEPIKENVVPDPNKIASIIYTSGTSGNPKGVMHKTYNFSFASENAIKALNLNHSDHFFSYLPLSHIAERLLVEMGSIYSGGKINFAESLDKFPQNLKNAEPTVFLAVPRIWTKFQQGILNKMPQKKLNLFLKIPILSSIVKKKIRNNLGLKNARNVFTGAAAIPVSLLEWFKKIGIDIQEAYAMTENTCYSHVTLNNHIKFGYVGKPLPLCDVKISEEGEILIKHDALMEGYYKEPEMTKEVFTEDGFFRTGDKGIIDKEGFLKITGRVKDLFKTSKGKYIAPAPIELKLSSNTDIEQICVVGIGLPQPIALTVLSEIARQKSKEEVKESLQKSLEVLNPQLDDHESIKKIIVLNDEWTIENNILTPSLKIKRGMVDEKYAPSYEKWYDTNGSVIWQS